MYIYIYICIYIYIYIIWVCILYISCYSRASLIIHTGGTGVKSNMAPWKCDKLATSRYRRFTSRTSKRSACRFLPEDLLPCRFRNVLVGINRDRRRIRAISPLTNAPGLNVAHLCNVPSCHFCEYAAYSCDFTATIFLHFRNRPSVHRRSFDVDRHGYDLQVFRSLSVGDCVYFHPSVIPLYPRQVIENPGRTSVPRIK